jgi:hypothetical protein
MDTQKDQRHTCSITREHTRVTLTTSHIASHEYEHTKRVTQRHTFSFKREETKIMTLITSHIEFHVQNNNSNVTYLPSHI